MDQLYEILAQTFHPWAGQYPCGGGRPDSLVPRPHPCGLPRTTGPAPPLYRPEGVVCSRQVSPVSAWSGNVRHSSEVSLFTILHKALQCLDYRCGAFSKVKLVGLLEAGELVGVSPGGARECIFDDSCSVMWRNRFSGQ